MTSVIIDTDPGTDDAIALTMALNGPDLDVVGVTTVGGNATLAHTTRNALRVLEHVGRADVPVHRGAARPLRGKYHYGYYFHGAAGLGVRLPAPRTAPHSVRAPEYIVRAASRLRGELTVIALGPLTNIARALAIEPRLAERINELVVMGGAIEVPGNVTPHAEFNIYNDPVAANIVFSSGMPITLVGLDVCTQTYLTRGGIPWVRSDTKAARLTNRIFDSWFATHPESDRYDLCDPLAVVAALRPDLLTYKKAKVAVETGDTERFGRTTAAYGEGPVKVALGVDVPGSMGLMRRLLSGVG